MARHLDPAVLCSPAVSLVLRASQPQPYLMTVWAHGFWWDRSLVLFVPGFMFLSSSGVKPLNGSIINSPHSNLLCKKKVEVIRVPLKFNPNIAIVSTQTFTRYNLLM